MMPALEYVVPFVAGGALTLGLTPVAKAVARGTGAVAKPSSDRWHSRPTPLLGGTAICIATVAAVYVAGLADLRAWIALAAGTVLAVVGLVDDYRPLRPATKLIAQVLVACALAFISAHRQITGVLWLDGLIAIIWIVAVTNAFNLLDNMDGLCAGVGGIAATAFCLATMASDPALASVGAALAGACAAFLVFNYHPASIFLGDAGSLFIGGTLAMLTSAVGHRDSLGALSSLAFPALLMLIPLFDTTFVTLSRKLSSRKASVGGRDHTSHRLVAMGFPERQAVLLLYGLAGLGGIAAVSLIGSLETVGPALTGVLIVALGLLGVRLARVNVYGGTDFSALKGRSYTPVLVDFTYKRRVFEVLLDLLLAAIAYYSAYVIRFGDAFRPLYADLFAQSLPLVIACELAGLFAGGVYRGIWRYATLADLMTYVRGVAIGSTTTLLALVYLYRFESYSRSVFLINALLFGLMVAGSRLSFRGLGELAARYRKSGDAALIYGAGDGGALLVRELRNNHRHGIHPIGFLDDDPAKQGRTIMGLRVLGGADDLPEIVRQRQPRAILVSTELPYARRRLIQQVADEHGVMMLVLRFSLVACGDAEDLITSPPRQTDASLPV